MRNINNKTPGLLCVAIAADSSAADPQGEVAAAAIEAEAYADVIEIRLDSIINPVIDKLVRGIQTPLLFTNRPAWEGGSYRGNEETRISILLEALQLGAAYVDVEMKTSRNQRQRIIHAAKDIAAHTIVSWHNFEETPADDDLEKVFRMQYESGADIGKIVTMAHSSGDVLRVLDLFHLAAENSFPLIAFCMGKIGVISRVATLGLGGYMTYGAPDSGRLTAPGQIKASALRDILRLMRTAN